MKNGFKIWELVFYFFSRLLVDYMIAATDSPVIIKLPKVSGLLQVGAVGARRAHRYVISSNETHELLE